MLDKQVEDSQGLLPQKKPIAHSFVHVSKKMKNKELLECSNIKLYVLIGLTGLFVFSFVFSSKISDGCVKDPFLEKKIESCSPQLVVLKENQINPTDHFYSTLLRVGSAFSAPVFMNSRKTLCNINIDEKLNWNGCLPITGIKTEPYCNAPDRMDLLIPQTKASRCFGSALHMILKDVYEEFKQLHASPIIVYGTMLGAIRNQSVIPFTEDADIGYVDPKVANYSMEEARKRLGQKGYHLFLDDIWRVCIGPSHPLAGNLYDSEYSSTFARGFSVPYVDLYGMEPIKGKNDQDFWKIDKIKDQRLIPKKLFEPYSHITINGELFDSVADPIDFLVNEYGEDYMVPIPRKRRRA